MEQPKPVIERPPGLKEAYATKNGELIHVTRIGAEHLAAHPTVIPLLDEAMPLIELPSDGSKLVSQVDLKRPLEEKSLITTPDIGLDGEDWFAVRSNRQGASRVTMEKPTEMISTVVIAAWPPVAEPTKYILRTAYIGTISPQEPWNAMGEEVQKKSIEFWTTHAMVHSPETMGEPFRSTWRKVLAEAEAKKAASGSVY